MILFLFIFMFFVLLNLTFFIYKYYITIDLWIMALNNLFIIYDIKIFEIFLYYLIS